MYIQLEMMYIQYTQPWNSMVSGRVLFFGPSSGYPHDKQHVRFRGSTFFSSLIKLYDLYHGNLTELESGDTINYSCYYIRMMVLLL